MEAPRPNGPNRSSSVAEVAAWVRALPRAALTVVGAGYCGAEIAARIIAEEIDGSALLEYRDFGTSSR